MKKRLKPFFATLMCDTETPVSLFFKLAYGRPYAFLLESAETMEKIGRFSFLGFDPFILCEFEAATAKNPLAELKRIYENISYKPDPALPNLQAGFVGYFSYETARHLHKIRLPISVHDIPEAIFFLPKNLLVFDHFARTLTLICYSKNDLMKLKKDVLEKSDSEIFGISIKEPSSKNNTNKIFEKMVEESKEKICAGEIFQIVVSQLFEQKTAEKPFDIYRKLRIVSPSPYMYYLQYPNFSIIGSSPETLVRTEGDKIVIRPIAGTRRKGLNEKEMKALENELLNDEKEQAEHMMLVDLGRNDIGSVSENGSIKVTKLMEVEKFSHVMHLVSEIRGTKKKSATIFDVFASAFPAGTLTGAPKKRAIQTIASLEKKPRGIYGGAVGYFDLSGNMDFAIAIRTILHSGGIARLRTGAGIVYDSTAKNEQKECINKARAPLTALS